MLFHQLANLEEAVVLMEASASVEVGAYLMRKAWKGQVEKKGAR